MTVYVGTSGWQYRHWASRYYAGVPQAKWLDHYAGDFSTVELNVSFYHLPRPEVFAGWAARTPDDFVFTAKASRYLTHIRRLRDPREPVERFMKAAGRLGPKLGAVLVQLPPDLERDTAALDETLAAFPPDLRVAVEFRHASWFDPDAEAVLRAHGAAVCLTDRDSDRSPILRTADWTYLRFHSGCGSPRPCYDVEAIEGWVRAVADRWPASADLFVFFNNDGEGCAVRDAALTGAIFAAAGFDVARTRDATGIPIG